MTPSRSASGRTHPPREADPSVRSSGRMSFPLLADTFAQQAIQAGARDV